VQNSQRTARGLVRKECGRRVLVLAAEWRGLAQNVHARLHLECIVQVCAGPKVHHPEHHSHLLSQNNLWLSLPVKEEGTSEIYLRGKEGSQKQRYDVDTIDWPTFLTPDASLNS
jgi:hypothetical protein